MISLGFHNFTRIPNACDRDPASRKMASLSCKLHPLKVTIHPTRGKVETKLVYRFDSLSRSQAVVSADKSIEKEPRNVEDVEHSSQIQGEDFCEGPSLHTLQKQANSAAWERIRHQLLCTIMECEAMPHNQLCIKCDDADAHLRCLRCHPSA